jgi:hypothetical protein
MLRSLAVVFALVASQAAHAACVIDRLRPMDTIPTMGGTDQAFMFLATNDCTMLRFGVFGTGFTRVPTMGGAYLFAPDWSGDGVQEVVVGAPYQMGTGLIFVHNSEQF